VRIQVSVDGTADEVDVEKIEADSSVLPSSPMPPERTTIQSTVVPTAVKPSSHSESSVVGQMGAFGQANYSASKGGIIAFTKTLALEMARYNITANSIAPGYTSTEMVEAIPEEVAAQIKAKIPLGRFALPEEIAKAALWRR
jgi:NADP-dependent 3-hydroxy acid dehydrogenase YdfG